MASFDLDALKSLGQLRTQVRADELLALCNAVLAGQRMGDFLGEAHVLAGAYWRLVEHYKYLVPCDLSDEEDENRRDHLLAVADESVKRIQGFFVAARYPETPLPAQGTNAAEPQKEN